MRSLFGKLLATYIFIVLATVFMLGIAVSLLYPEYEANVRALVMTEHARRIAEQVREHGHLDDVDRRSLRSTLNMLERTTGFWSAVSDTYGIIPVRSDGLSDPEAEQFHLFDFRTIAREAGTAFLQGEEVTIRQDGNILSVRLAYGNDAGEWAGVVVVASELHNFWSGVLELPPPILYASLAAIALATGVGYIFSRTLTRPIRAMTAAVRAMRQGDFSTRVAITSSDELGSLADGFNALAEQLGATLADLRKQERLRRDFLANVSHDLRTPLTTLRGFLQAIAEGLVDDAAATRRSARVMLRETMRLIRLVNALLDLSKLQSGTLELHREAIDFASYAEDLTVPFLPQIESKRLTLETDIPPDLPRLWVDPSRFEQIFINLFQNAVKFTRPGDRITLRAAVDSAESLRKALPGVKHAIRITVEDTGPGIAPEDLPYIWERFYKGDKSRENTAESGAGLGLVIVKDLVLAHGGNVDVRSDENGTAFTIWLPAVAAPADEDEKATEARSA